MCITRVPRVDPGKAVDFEQFKREWQKRLANRYLFLAFCWFGVAALIGLFGVLAIKIILAL